MSLRERERERERGGGGALHSVTDLVASGSRRVGIYRTEATGPLSCSFSIITDSAAKFKCKPERSGGANRLILKTLIQQSEAGSV